MGEWLVRPIAFERLVEQRAPAVGRLNYGRVRIDAVGAGRRGFGAISTSEKNFRETAIGEATERAAAAVAERLIELRATTLKP